MQLPSLEVVELWPTPNYVSPVTRDWGNVILHLVLYPLVCIALSIRIYTRVSMRKSFELDDWLIIGTFFPTTAFIILSLLLELRWEWNRHVWDVQFPMIVLGLKILITTQILFAVIAGLTKCSVLTLVYRLVSKDKGPMAKLSFTAIILIVAQSVTFCLVVVLQCRPVSQYWTPHIGPQENCISEPFHLLAAGCINTFVDLITVLLPLPTVWSLRLPLRQQVVTVSLLTAGVFVTAAGAVRTYYTWKVTVSTDPTWIIYKAWMCTSIELYLGIICANLPATKKFFSTLLPGIICTQVLTFSRPPSQLTVKLPRPYDSPAITAETDLELGTSLEGDFERQENTSNSAESMPSSFLLRPDSLILNSPTRTFFAIADSIPFSSSQNSMTLSRSSSTVSNPQQINVRDEETDAEERRISDSNVTIILPSSESRPKLTNSVGPLPSREQLASARGVWRQGETEEETDISTSVLPVELARANSTLSSNTIDTSLHKEGGQVNVIEEALEVPIRYGQEIIPRRTFSNREGKNMKLESIGEREENESRNGPGR